MLQAYIDESGIKGTDRVLVFAGFIAKAEEWADVSNEWNRFARSIPSVRCLKMNDAVRLNGDFYGWTEKERNDKLHGFVDILKCRQMRAVYCSIDLAAHELMGFRKPLKDPYFLGFYTMLSGVCYDTKDQGVRDEIELIFEENVIFGPRAITWYPRIKELLNVVSHPAIDGLAERLPPMPTFRNDCKFPPLQCADVLAWLFRNSLAGKNEEFSWVSDELRSHIPMSQHSVHLDEPTMRRNRAWTEEVHFLAANICKWMESR